LRLRFVIYVFITMKGFVVAVFGYTPHSDISFFEFLIWSMNAFSFKLIVATYDLSEDPETVYCILWLHYNTLAAKIP